MSLASEYGVLVVSWPPQECPGQVRGVAKLDVGTIKSILKHTQRVRIILKNANTPPTTNRANFFPTRKPPRPRPGRPKRDKETAVAGRDSFGVAVQHFRVVETFPRPGSSPGKWGVSWTGLHSSQLTLVGKSKSLSGRQLEALESMWRIPLARFASVNKILQAPDRQMEHQEDL